MLGKIILLFFCLIGGSFAQNLISNPGFENGAEGWEDLWTRDAGVGLSEIVSHPVHSGSRAAHVKHWGARDWSFKPEGYVAVQSGAVYTFTAWVNVRRLDGSAGLCIAAFDASREVVDWSYVFRPFAATADTFRQFTTRVIIPQGVSYVWPRFIGDGECDIFIDDVEFYQSGEPPEKRRLTLENAQLEVIVHTADLSMQITDKRTRETYTAGSSNGFWVQSVDSLQEALVFHCLYLPDDFNVEVHLDLHDNSIAFRLTADAEARLSGAMQFPGVIPTKANEYFIIPYAAGVIQPVSSPFPEWGFDMWAWKSTMAFMGVTDLHSGYMIVSDDPWDTRIDYKEMENGLFAPKLFHVPSKSQFGYERTFYYTFVSENGYVEMCQWYRRHVEELGYVKTWPEKIAENANVQKLQGAVDFWALDWQFRTDAFKNEMVNFGVDRAVYSLGGGWGPQDGFSVLIDSLNALGYLSSRYDIYTDVWPPTYPDKPWYRTEGYPEDVIVDRDGSLHKGWLAYLDDGTPFQGYYTCSKTHSYWARKWIAEDLQNNRYNARFIDVETASALTECWSPDHPATRKEDSEHRKQLLNIVKNEFGLVTGSEEAREATFPVVDWGEGTMTIVPARNAGYDWATPIDDPGPGFIRYTVNPAARVPLHALVYHDVHVATWYTGDGVSKAPAYWDDKDLFNILYASMPLFMPLDKTHWQNNLQRFLTSYHLVGSVFREAGFARMTDHKMLSQDRKVQQTEFDNGWRVAANFGSSDYVYGGAVLPAKGFYATNGDEEVYRIKEQGEIVAAAVLQDKLFINPYGRMTTLHGVRSDGALVLIKHENFIHLAFIGDQNRADIDPAALPWPMQGVKAFTISGRETPLESPANGWLQLRKQGDERFYRLEGDFISTAVKSRIDLPPEAGLAVFPNPFNLETTISFTVRVDGMVSLRLFNLLGEQVATLVHGRRPAGEYKAIFNGSGLPSGLYFLRLDCNGETIVMKSIIAK